MSGARTAIVTLITLGAGSVAWAQEPDGEDEEESATELAKKQQNPVGDLISLPFQFNFNSGATGLGDRSITNLNFQPVFPIHLTPQWNLISRSIVPFYSIPNGFSSSATGLGDIEEELFFTPVASSGFIWGLGPIFSVPTATLGAVSTGSWAAGPAGLALVVEGPWVAGALATATWTFSDSGNSRKTGLFLVQPFINYNLGQSGWALVTAPLITLDWGTTNQNVWTVPLGAGVSWTTKIGSQAMTLGAQYYYSVERPDDGTRNQLRIVVSFLFPQKHPPQSTTTAQR